MKQITKTIITLAAISLLFAGCDAKKDKNVRTASTIEEIQAQKGKPARVAKAEKTELSDIRKYSGTIEGMQQTSAIAKMGDPLSKINVQVGSKVKKDQVIAEFLYTGDNTQYQQASQQVELLQKATERMREVHQMGAVSQQDMDAQELQLKLAKMNLETARRATKILAPSAGVVTEIKYKVGQVPGVGSVICTIANLDQVILKLNISSQDISLFKKDAKASVTLTNGAVVEGKVSLIPLAASAVTRFFPVEVTFDNKKNLLLPGMYVTADINLQNVDGVVVPPEAIVYRNGANYVWTVEADGTAKRNDVRLGVQTANGVQIQEGIEEGATVMVEGQSKMNEGDKVLVID